MCIRFGKDVRVVGTMQATRDLEDIMRLSPTDWKRTKEKIRKQHSITSIGPTEIFLFAVTRIDALTKSRRMVEEN